MEKQNRVSREVWEERIARWKKSGQAATAYARSIGVHPKTFSYWRWKLSQEAPGESVERNRPRGREVVRLESSPSFLELVAPMQAASSERIELVLPSGVRVQVPTNFDADALRRVVGVLGGA